MMGRARSALRVRISSLQLSGTEFTTSTSVTATSPKREEKVFIAVEKTLALDPTLPDA